jgi:hypothetical protein
MIPAAVIAYLILAGQLYDAGKLPFDLYSAHKNFGPRNAFIIAADIAGLAGAPAEVGIGLGVLSWMAKHPDRMPHQNHDVLGRGGRRP